MRDLSVHPLRRAALWLLLAVMVLAQASALMHRVLHAQERHAHSSVSTSKVTPVQSNLTELWGEHTQRSDCQLFDQLATVAPPLAIPVLVVSLVPCGLGMGVSPSPSFLFERFYSAQAPPVLL